MKKTLFSLVSSFSFLSASSLLATPGVSEVIARQQWPWSTDVHIDFIVSGASAEEPAVITLTATDNGTAIDIPAAAVSGDLYGIAQNGLHRITLDPTRVPALVSEGATENFGVQLTATVGDPILTEKLYVIVDLLKTNSYTYVTRADLLNGKYGAYETNPSWLSNNSLTNVLVWTGVTDDVAYATTKLVLRKIPAGEFMMGSATNEKYCATNETPLHKVVLTEDYYVGVYELTLAQWTNAVGGKCALTNSAGVMAGFHVDGERRPVNPSYCLMRQTDNGRYDARPAAYSWPDNQTSVSPNSFCGLLDAKTGLSFDLPTEAQWEYACRAGTTGDCWYSGARINSRYYANYNMYQDANVATLARYRYNGGIPPAGGEWDVSVNTTGGTANVGSYLPNGWGLYDTLGNLWELCRDYYSTNSYRLLASDVVTNPVGVARYTDPRYQDSRVIRGGSCVCAAFQARHAVRDFRYDMELQKYTGARVMMKIPSTGK